jgi:hypothetical protein
MSGGRARFPLARSPPALRAVAAEGAPVNVISATKAAPYRPQPGPRGRKPVRRTDLNYRKAIHSFLATPGPVMRAMLTYTEVTPSRPGPARPARRKPQAGGEAVLLPGQRRSGPQRSRCAGCDHPPAPAGGRSRPVEVTGAGPGTLRGGQRSDPYVRILLWRLSGPLASG